MAQKFPSGVTPSRNTCTRFTERGVRSAPRAVRGIAPQPTPQGPSVTERLYALYREPEGRQNYYRLRGGSTVAIFRGNLFCLGAEDVLRLDSGSGYSSVHMSGYTSKSLSQAYLRLVPFTACTLYLNYLKTV